MSKETSNHGIEQSERLPENSLTAGSRRGEEKGLPIPLSGPKHKGERWDKFDERAKEESEELGNSNADDA